MLAGFCKKSCIVFLIYADQTINYYKKVKPDTVVITGQFFLTFLRNNPYFASAMQKIKTYRIVFLIAVSFLIGSVVFNSLNTLSVADIASIASVKVSKKVEKSVEVLTSIKNNGTEKNRIKLLDIYKNEKIGVYLFRHDSLLYWNNAQIPIDKSINIFEKDNGLVKLRQGYYLYTKLKWDEVSGIALCLVRPLYDLQNNYLKNDFVDWMGIPKNIEFSLINNDSNVVFSADTKLFSLKSAEENYSSDWASNISLLLFVMAFLFGLLAALLMINNGIGWFGFIACVFTVLIARVMMIYFKWPAFIYGSVLYDLSVFGNAQSQINFYLGDILFNAFVLLFLAFAFATFKFERRHRYTAVVGVIGAAILSLITVVQYNNTIIDLITNSTLNFDFLSIFSIKIQAFIGIASLAIYALALYVSVKSIILFFDKSIKGFLLFGAIVFVICLSIDVFSSFQTFENYWFFGFSLCLFILSKFNILKFSLGLGLQILLMSLITSLLLSSYIDKSQKQNLDRLSSDLTERRDAVLESEFSDIPQKIANDEKLALLLSFLPSGKKELEQLLKQKYFSEYFNRYNIEFSLFDSYCNPLLSPKEPVLMNEGFFDDQIKYYGDSSSVPGLFFVHNYKNNSVYIGKIKMSEKNLFVFMRPKQFEELGSFPDLLLDQSQQKQEVFKNFSYAIYRAGQNISRYGTFNYPFFILDSVALAKSNPDFNHYYFQNEEFTQVISQKRRTAADQFTYNSYIFLFFSVISYLFALTYSLFFTSQLKHASLTRRIQAIIIILLLLVMSAVGITSGRLISGQFEADNKKQLREKSEVIINELAVEFKPDEFFDEGQKEIINSRLNEYAHLFNTVISVFDKNGYLFNTSQPRLYDLGLAAPLVNPLAFWNLKQNQSSVENVIESAGTLDYFSLYTPIYNSKQELLGFLNLPYFATRSDLASELSGIISALINVYVILFVISILTGLILSGYITKPLRLIQQQISNISLGKQNEKIEWQSSDEIGRLVAEYNQMLIKLENSATLLAQSERESAWREMAKQVAHEIKNPLTPMKLNLQYLQHLKKSNPFDFDEKFSKTSAGIIEQIDSLATIANAFSNFAKLPATQLKSINLAEIINASVLIFEDQQNNKIKNLIDEKEIFVKGDRDQCLRVFNNILKNANQATDETEQPNIEINCVLFDGKIIIQIKDNGCGIADELKSNIFNPNFTTKSTGSGLGLAMVKNIMQGFGGRVWFDSEKNVGSVFYLEFILANDTDSQ